MIDFQTATAADAVGQTFRPEWGGQVRVLAIGGRDVCVATLTARPGKQGWELGSETISRECAALRVRDGLWGLVPPGRLGRTERAATPRRGTNMYQDARDDAAARERRLGDLEAAGVTHRVITADNRDVFQVVTYLDPGEFPDQDGHGYEIAYYGWERHQHTGDVFCGSCARELVKALEPGDEAGVYVAYQINAEVGDRETIHCTDCMRVVYAGADLDWDPANAPEGQRL